MKSYASIYVGGFVFGKKNLSYIQLIPITLGIGQLGSDPRFRAYLGAMANILQVSGEL